MTPRHSPVNVHGGAGGIVAECADILAMAGQFGAVAGDSLHSSWQLHGYLLHPGLATSALFDPCGYALFEADLLDALDGPRGLSLAGAECGLVDGELRVAAEAYRSADQLCTRLHDGVFGAARVPAAMLAGVQTLSRTGDPIAAAQSVLAHDPQVADTVIDALGIPQTLALTAVLLPDGHGVLHSLGRDTGGRGAEIPRRLTDIVGELAHREADTRHGTIDVRMITLADGSRRAIVDVTGTRSWTPLPTGDVTSLTTNGRALVGRGTAYEQGVLAAMRTAGVRPSDPVMMVGHSQGGMVAVNAARDAVRSGEFTVTHVVTAGSPVGRTVGMLPSSVQVLALENAKDVVPHLDGVANPDEPNITTVSAAHGDGTVVDDHDITASYLPLTDDTQRSGNASVRHFLSTAGGYFQGTAVDTHVYQVTRQY